MHIEQIVVGDFATNCYIVPGATPGTCVIVDPADGGKALLALLDRLGLRPVAVLLTHGHYDHILAVPDLQERWPDLPVYCHPLDISKELVEYDMGKTYPTVAAFHNVHLLSDGQALTLAGLTVEVLATPGHTPGSVTFRVGDALFTGDTLFCEDIGRTDFEGGDMGAMKTSLARLAALEGDYQVLPGHDETSTLSHEKQHNPYLKPAFLAKF